MRLGVLTPGMYIEIRQSGEATAQATVMTRPGETRARPRIPPGFGPASDGGTRHATVSATSGGERFRLRGAVDRSPTRR